MSLTFRSDSVSQYHRVRYMVSIHMPHGTTVSVVRGTVFQASTVLYGKSSYWLLCTSTASEWMLGCIGHWNYIKTQGLWERRPHKCSLHVAILTLALARHQVYSVGHSYNYTMCHWVLMGASQNPCYKSIWFKKSTLSFVHKCVKRIKQSLRQQNLSRLCLSYLVSFQTFDCTPY